MQVLPEIVDWLRVRRSGRKLVVLVAITVGTFMLLRDAGTLRLALASLPHANPIGLLLTGVFGALTYPAAAVALTAASGCPLPLARTAAAQLAAACTNRIAPAGIGGMATNVRYLEGNGVPRSQALTAIGITSIASFCVHTIAMIAALALVHRPVGALMSATPAILPAPALLAGVIVATAVGTFVARRFGTRAKVALRESCATVGSMCADPGRLARMLAGTIGVTFGHGFAFVAAVTACGVHLGVMTLLSVFLAGSAAASVAPTPGGLGALEAAFVAGLTTLGSPAVPALAGVLTYRLITYWLPILPGAVALGILRRGELARSTPRAVRRSALCQLPGRSLRRALGAPGAPPGGPALILAGYNVAPLSPGGSGECRSPRADEKLVCSGAGVRSS